MAHSTAYIVCAAAPATNASTTALDHLKLGHGQRRPRCFTRAVSVTHYFTLPKSRCTKTDHIATTVISDSGERIRAVACVSRGPPPVAPHTAG